MQPTKNPTHPQHTTKPHHTTTTLVVGVIAMLLNGCADTTSGPQNGSPASPAAADSATPSTNTGESTTSIPSITAAIAANPENAATADPAVAVPEDAYHVIYTSEAGFIPQRLDMPTGETIVFVNDSDAYVWPASNIHPTHAVLPSFDPQRALKPGEVWAYRFDKNGHWRYHNHLEPSETGIIVTSGGGHRQPRSRTAGRARDRPAIPRPARNRIRRLRSIQRRHPHENFHETVRPLSHSQNPRRSHAGRGPRLSPQSPYSREHRLRGVRGLRLRSGVARMHIRSLPRNTRRRVRCTRYRPLRRRCDNSMR